MWAEFTGLIVTAVILAGVGCGNAPAPDGTVFERLQAKDPAIRIQASVEAGNRKQFRAIPLLIDRLSDSDSDVRMFAGMALRKITGKDFGWRPWKTPRQRDEAIRRWRQWAVETLNSPKLESASPETQPSQ